MIWIGGPGEILLMAAIAGCGERRVIVVHVATRAGHRGVEAGQREGRGVVIETRAGPVRS